VALLVDWPIYAVVGFQPGLTQKIVSAVTIAISLVYLFLAQRRFYADTTGTTVIKTVLLWAGRFVITVVIMGGSLIAAVAMVR
jgi:TM2 domain-containing membrane protein YozV